MCVCVSAISALFHNATLDYWRKNTVSVTKNYSFCDKKIQPLLFVLWYSIVFATNGGMSRKCQAFYKRMVEIMAEKRNNNISVATNVI